MTAVVEAVRGAPTLDDARRVAAAFVDAGVAEVLVFGSVARGDASASSDIDLVAIFVDLGDYAMRHARARELGRLARAVSGHECDVKVTDFCEWAWRTQRVSSSFEHHISSECVRLAKTPKKCAYDSRKPIGMPADNLAEATSRIKQWIVDELVAIQNALVPTEPELEARHREDDEDQAMYRGNRNQAICVAAALVVEKALKIAMQMQGTYPISDKEFAEIGHDIQKALAPLRGELGQRLRLAVSAFGLSAEILSQWRVRATYGDIVPPEFEAEDTYSVAERLIDDHVRTGVTVVMIVMAALRAEGSTHPDIDLADRLSRKLWSRLRITSPLDGELRVTPLEERPWEAVWW